LKPEHAEEKNLNKLYSPFKLGPLNLRNRTVRAAAFEGMCPGNLPSQELVKYHRSVAAMFSQMATCIQNVENLDPLIEKMLR
jgi:2,4-dienoyl-CoA reductase-like NADH-dependent reductase (Old Yellow Enzyme family)